ncbi:MAG: 8-amino-7-oxononanoate synthase [Pseudomonadota bacterium]|nr:8-amino-7-oxononanoate synthase [Pseudomonadota bacterium]
MSSLGSLIRYAEARLERLQAAGQQRTLKPTHRLPGLRARRSDRPLISFCDNDYLALSSDPRLVRAAAQAAETFGVGAGASRLVTGDCPLNQTLENEIARIKGMPACRVFGSGYLANIGAVPALVGVGDTIIMDELSHACMHAGARLSGADIRVFRHNDVRHAEALFEDATGQVLLMTETVFSMDGDLAPLIPLAELCERYEAWLMTDDAHGLGVIDQHNPAPLQMGTLSKAAGTYGGYVCGPAPVVDMFTSRARSLVYTTGLPAPVLASAICALEIMQAEPERAARARANAEHFCKRMALPRTQSVIVPMIIGDESRAMALSGLLEEAGFLVTAIRPPTVPKGTSRLRITFSAGHSQEDVDGLADALQEAMIAA